MIEIDISARNGESKILCGEGALSNSAGGFQRRKNFVVTDSNVFGLYGGLIEELFGKSFVYVLPAGEKSKNYRNLFSILNKMLASGMKRSDTVVAFGGGVVGDIAGLAASLYMRGTDLVQIPTTLLSQVDSSVGGKTAVNAGKIKNAFGAFDQPRLVIADPLFLKTLPAKQIRCGLGEIVTYGGIDAEIDEVLLRNAGKLKSEEFLADIIPRCIECKADIVRNDEFDVKGIRKYLNLGHTTGHALELFYSGGSHGEYVLEGIYYELFIAMQKGLCADAPYAESLKYLITSIIKIKPRPDIEKAAVGAEHDKKNVDDDITLIAPSGVGKCAEIKLNKREYEKLLTRCTNEIKGEKL